MVAGPDEHTLQTMGVCATALELMPCAGAATTAKEDERRKTTEHVRLVFIGMRLEGRTIPLTIQFVDWLRPPSASHAELLPNRDHSLRK